MKNRVYLFASIFFVLGITPASANINYAVDANISIGGDIYIIVAGSSATSLTINSDNIVVDASGGGTFTIKSPDRYIFETFPTLGQACSVSDNRVVVTSGSQAQTIKPNTNMTCTVRSGGGGASSSAPQQTAQETETVVAPEVVVEDIPQMTETKDAVPIVILTPEQEAKLIASLEVQVKSLIAQINALLKSRGLPSLAGEPLLQNIEPITRNLTIGSEGADVLALQKVLNADGVLVASSGVGSVGNETSYFGILTESAVKRFQLKHGIVASPSDAGYGLVGPKTRAKLNELISG